MDDILDAISADNRSAAVDYIKSMMFDKAQAYIDNQKQHISKSMLGSIVGDDVEEDEYDEVNQETEEEYPEEQEDETNYGDD